MLRLSIFIIKIIIIRIIHWITFEWIKFAGENLRNTRIVPLNMYIYIKNMTLRYIRTFLGLSVTKFEALRALAIAYKQIK